MDIPLRALKQVLSFSNNAILNKILAGAGYGATAYVYGPATIADLELSSSQCLLLGLLHTLVTEEVTSCCMLAEICFKVRQLQSDHLRVWLIGDFVFPRSDMVKAITLLGKLLTTGVLKMPPHDDSDNLAIQLENAVAYNSPSDIINLASEGGNINGLTQSRDSLLHLAARNESCAAISALSFLKADLEVVNSSNVTPLEEAMKNNCVCSIKALLKAGAKVDKRKFRGDTYLHIAAAGGQNEILEILLEAGLNINETNYYGETPLLCAVRAGNARGMEILLEKGADISIIPEGCKTLLEMIMDIQNIDKLKQFLKVKIMLELKSDDGDTILHLAARSGNAELFKVFTNQNHLTAGIKNQSGKMPLHVASDVSIVGMLLRMGVDLDSQDNNGCTTLMIASKNSMADIVKLLLHNGANPKIKDNDGRTPLHYAAEGGCVEAVSILLDIGGKVGEMDSSGRTPSFFAAVKNKPAVLQLLAERGADLTLRNSTEHGIIHHAVCCGNVEAVTALLDAGVDVDLKGQDQMTRLCYAAEKGHVPLVKLLLDCGADIRGKTSYGSTALMWASQEGHLDMIQLLVVRDAPVDDKTFEFNKWTSLQYVYNNEHKAVIEYLKSKGGIM
ncbi:Putative ankyrin [Halyomorpha halys]|nr:Putative ankyrin [Halyomorpha halys]